MLALKRHHIHFAIRNPETGVVKVEVSPSGDLVWLERSLEVSSAHEKLLKTQILFLG